MARVTVEDCIDKVPNRFDLVLMAAQRCSEIAPDAHMTTDPDAHMATDSGKDKSPVLALREIAEGAVQVDDVREALLRSLQTYVDDDQPEDDDFDTVSADLAAQLDNLEPSEVAGATGTAAAKSGGVFLDYDVPSLPPVDDSDLIG